jgi:hypothetical protein
MKTMLTYGKRKSVYAKWKTYFTFMQTTVYMKWIAALTVFIFSLPAYAQDSMSAHYKIYDTRTKQVITIDKIVADMSMLMFYFLEKSIMIALVIIWKIKFSEHYMHNMQIKLF